MAWQRSAGAGRRDQPHDAGSLIPGLLNTIDGTRPIRDVDNRGAMSFHHGNSRQFVVTDDDVTSGPAPVTPTPSTV